MTCIWSRYIVYNASLFMNGKWDLQNNFMSHGENVLLKLFKKYKNKRINTSMVKKCWL